MGLQRTPLYVGVDAEVRQRWNELLEFSRFPPGVFLELLLDLYENLAEPARGEIKRPLASREVAVRPILDRMMLRVDQGGPLVPGAPHLGQCWLWTGAKNEKGHGIITVKIDGKMRHFRVHRVMWEAMNGPIENDDLILHRCFHHLCVRPEHLVRVDKRKALTEAIQTSLRAWSS